MNIVETIKKKIFVLLFLCLFLCGTSSQAQNYEHVLNFHSDIRIDTTGRVDVTESIKVLVTGESIKKGIVRTIPLYRMDKNNVNKKVDINVISVSMNGKSEKSFTDVENQDLAIYIGKKNVELTPDVYEYTIKYWTRGHVGFFDDYDEIYWNVNGNDWTFDIDTITATVYLPLGAKFRNNACYTGTKGSTTNDCSFRSIGDTIIEFYGNSHFRHNEGLTIATSFTPHVIKRPLFSEKVMSRIESFINDFKMPIMLALGIAVILTSFFIFKKKINNRNGRQIVIPQFSSPEDKSPASLRYLFNKNFDYKCFVACILSMAVKNAIKIKKTKLTYTLTALDNTDELTKEELEVYLGFFSENKEIELGNRNKASRIKKALNALRDRLPIYNKIQDYFPSNGRYSIPFILLSYLIIILGSFAAHSFADIQQTSINLVLLTSVWMIALLPWKKNIFLGLLFVIVPFLSFFQVMLCLVDSSLWYLVILIWVVSMVDLLSLKYFKPLTKKGATFMTNLKGFKMYLSVAEENRINALNPPDLTPSLFEEMLPYAVALDLEIKWAEKFEEVFIESNYQPMWYDGRSDRSLVRFTSDLSKSLSREIDKSIYVPSSNSSNDNWSSGSSSSGSSSWDSGSSGSGSSGGGGGGGGGRGW